MTKHADVMGSRSTGQGVPARLGRVFLVVYFAGASIALGGAAYSSRVVEELWSSAPPASLRQWAPVMAAAGENFWSRITPLTGLFALLTLATSFTTAGRRRLWRIAGSVPFLFVVASSLLFFAPTVERLSPPALDALSPGEAAAMVRAWTRYDAIRMLVLVAAWACTLRALTIGRGGADGPG